MQPELIMHPNDVTRSIQLIIKDLRGFESDLCDYRIKALILTKLEEAELFSLRLIGEGVPEIDIDKE